MEVVEVGLEEVLEVAEKGLEEKGAVWGRKSQGLLLSDLTLVHSSKTRYKLLGLWWSFQAPAEMALEEMECSVVLEEVGEEGVLVMVAALEVKEVEGDQGQQGLEVEVEMLGHQKEG